MARKGKTTEEFKQEIYNLVGDEYELLDEYSGCHTKLEFRHVECDYKWKVRPTDFLNGRRCPKHKNDWSRKSHENFISEVSDITKGEYTVLGKYNSSFVKINFIHNRCGNIYKTTPANFLKGRRCTKCNKPKGEKKISEWLNENKINYESQYTFDDCKNIRKLPFDFSLFNENEFSCLIEYDGEQHFTSIDYYGGIEKFNKGIKCDKIKNKHCIENNIPLVRIPYWEFNNVEYILENVLKHYNLIESDNTYDKEIVLKYLVDKNWDQNKYIVSAPCNKTNTLELIHI